MDLTTNALETGDHFCRSKASGFVCMASASGINMNEIREPSALRLINRKSFFNGQHHGNEQKKLRDEESELDGS